MRQVADWSIGEGIGAAPTVWNDLVYVAKAGGDWGIKGRMMAFNVADGTLAWSFDLIPTGTETGADTWETPGSAEHGGGAAWTAYALDRETGTLFIPVGNPGPDYQKGMRKGANLFTISTVAIDARTGKLKWWYQLRPNDDHDWDNTTVVAVRRRRAQARRDRRQGRHPARRRPRNRQARVQAADDDGAQSRRADHAGGRARVPGGRHPMERRRAQPEDRICSTSTRSTGARCSSSGPSRSGSRRFRTPGSPTAGAPTTRSDKWSGWINAVDPKTGKMAWRVHTPAPMYAALTPTAGNVLFTGDLLGNFLALDARNGKTLYSFDTGGPIAGGVITYEQQGQAVRRRRLRPQRRVDSAARQHDDRDLRACSRVTRAVPASHARMRGA